MLNNKLKKLREQKNMTQRELAEAIGVGQSTIGMIESGKNKGSNDTILKLAKYFDVSIDYLLSAEEKLYMANSAIDEIHKIAESTLDYSIGNLENSIYTITTKYDSEKFSKEEQKQIIDFIDFIISKRKK